jgi:RNA polymerase sigma factor (sigma-70 family)
MGDASDDYSSEVEQLVSAEYTNALRFASSMTRDADIARDIVQESFTRLIGRWADVRDPRAYLFQIVANLGRNDARRSADAELPDAPADGHDAAGTVDTRLVVRAAVYALPSAQRNVVWLRYFVGMSLGEIGLVLGHPEGSVKSLHHHAKRRLSRTLALPGMTATSGRAVVRARP